MMARNQVSMEPEMHRRARERAAELGISFSEYVRRLVARDLSEPRRRNDPSVIFDLGNSGGTDIARDKDLLVGEAVTAAQARRPS